MSKIKKNLMTNFPDFHKIALLESKKNCNLEIVQYDETNPYIIKRLKTSKRFTTRINSKSETI